MSSTNHTVAIGITGLTLFAALALVIDRGGLIAWATALLAVGLLAKTLIRPTRFDLGLSIGLPAVAVLAWAGVFYCVITTYESGEVVQLSVETSSGPAFARLWVFDTNMGPTLYYDAPPQMAELLLAGEPMWVERAGQASVRTLVATPAETLAEPQAAHVLESMGAKYGERMTAADLYYVLLGRPRDRIPLVLTFDEAG